MENNEIPIGFIDSGVGGISVLKEAVKLLPMENYIYFGDSKNAPYGTKDVKDVQQLTFNACELLMSYNVKALVIACNTATSAAINEVREKYKFLPVIGIEPALKPAVELDRKGKIIIMATPMTLVEKKFNKLMLNYEKVAEIISLPCPGLVELIEKGIIEGDELEDYIRTRFSSLIEDDIAAVVLGCTHYPFIKKQLLKLLGEDTPILDGSIGTVKQLRKQLDKLGMLNSREGRGKIEILNSLDCPELISLSYKLFNL
ncbi:MAG: glutamate racemase [Clostridiaceae bacterium]|nr:glutamate racemase [Clostridiaceae bacterium]